MSSWLKFKHVQTLNDLWGVCEVCLVSLHKEWWLCTCLNSNLRFSELVIINSPLKQRRKGISPAVCHLIRVRITCPWMPLICKRFLFLHITLKPILHIYSYSLYPKLSWEGSLLKSLTSCCRSSLQVACDKSPYWMCWAERITWATADVWPAKVTHRGRSFPRCFLQDSEHLQPFTTKVPDWRESVITILKHALHRYYSKAYYGPPVGHLNTMLIEGYEHRKTQSRQSLFALQI